jgi:hypothetical protein
LRSHSAYSSSWKRTPRSFGTCARRLGPASGPEGASPRTRAQGAASRGGRGGRRGVGGGAGRGVRVGTRSRSSASKRSSRRQACLSNLGEGGAIVLRVTRSL